MLSNFYNFFTRKKKSPKHIEMKEFKIKPKHNSPVLSNTSSKSPQKLTPSFRSVPSKSPQQLTPSFRSVPSKSPSLSSISSSSSISSYDRRNNNTQKIYRERIKKSICVKRPKKNCLKQSECIFTNGDLRKYCRKKRTKY